MDYSKFEKLSSLSDEEFKALLDEYNYSKMSTLSVADQKVIKEKLEAESYRRMNLISHYDIGRESLIGKIENIEEKLRLLDKVTGGNYDAFPGISKDVKALIEEKEGLEEKLALVNAKIEANENKIDSMTDVVKKAKFSIAKRRLDVGKKAIFVTAPQKICDLGKSTLNKIKGNIIKFGKKSLKYSEKTEKKFEDYNIKTDESLAAIDDAMEGLMQELQETEQMRGYEKYVTQNKINQSLQKQQRKYERVVKKGYIVSKLQPGVVKMIKLPATIIDKLSNRQPVVVQQTAIGM